MIVHSNAYLKLKQSNQSDLDVVLLLCHAVPSLKGYIKAVRAGKPEKLPDPDHFQKPANLDRLLGIAPRYRKVVGRMLLLATFSYFEAYFNDLVAEVIAFHDGVEQWRKIATSRADRSPDAPEANKLREVHKRNKCDRYQSALEKLNACPNFVFPGERLSSFGIAQLAILAKDMRSVDIEMMSRDAFGVDVSDEEWQRFHRIRDLRNSIAHGDSKEMDLANAISEAKFLADLAMSIDRHVVYRFLILESAWR